jgi:hypothetical protein
MGYNAVQSVESQPMFRRNVCYLLHDDFLLRLIFDPENGRDVSMKRRLIFNGLYGVMSQNIELFITTAVRSSNPNYFFVSLKTGDSWSKPIKLRHIILIL